MRQAIAPLSIAPLRASDERTSRGGGGVPFGIVATLIRITGDFDLAEECTQDAFALERWECDGVPERAGAWLTTVARNRAVDRLRRAGNEQERLR